jgi:hypothetical protein
MKDVIFLTPIVLSIVITVVIIALYNYRLKRRIIDSGPIDDNALKFLTSLSGFGSEVLKWGIILLFGGLGLVVLEFIPIKASQSSLPYGVEAIFLAVGFLVYYFIVKKQKL